jgi:hypothetical protein
MRKSFCPFFQKEALPCFQRRTTTLRELIPSCDESDSYQSRPVDAANGRKQAVLFCKKEPKNSCL